MDALTPADPFAVTTPEALAALYPEPSYIVRNKTTDRLDAKTTSFITASPFFVLTTIGDRGPHGSPRGDAPGFVAVLDERTIAIPDRKGNNRLDALRDILDDPRVALLFFVPGMGETVRVHGTARITTDPSLRERFTHQGVVPPTVILVSVGEVFLQCARAILRSKLWGDRRKGDGVPTAGELLSEHMKGAVAPSHYDDDVGPRVARTLY
ncbi:MSMEG_1061 family FMN-dependent PPOX-type flavoprotein [Roseomonas sp. CCTCC AB2023176]|uniref:MSMEG_1061 family FMN-dependent PPOX-type flavoprotein n=1 Tax=Roseomonas sp. CCTCC AB2023176 TaxID=3342640 RepID=UPI0035D9E2C4